MTRFEEVGASLQQDCATVDQAIRTMNYSCRLCALKGINVSCDQCTIAAAHRQGCAIILDVEESRVDASVARVQSRHPIRRTYVSGKHRTEVCRYD